MNDAVEKYKQNLDWTIIVSTITAALIIGGSVFALRKAGLTTPASILAAGK